MRGVDMQAERNKAMNVTIIGAPQQRTIQSAQCAIKWAFEYMGYEGVEVDVVISEGAITFSDANLQTAALLDLNHASPIICISEGLLHTLLLEGNLRAEHTYIMAAYAAAYVATHFVQWQRGLLPKDEYTQVDSKTVEYNQKPQVIEARRIGKAAIWALYQACIE